jgi:hypothetical protein
MNKNIKDTILLITKCIIGIIITIGIISGLIITIFFNTFFNNVTKYENENDYNFQNHQFHDVQH